MQVVQLLRVQSKTLNQSSTAQQMECGDDDPERLLDDIDELFELINEVCVTNEEGAILSLKVWRDPLPQGV